MVASKTDTATVAQNRVVVSLPKEVGDQLDKLGLQVSAVVERETGVPIDLTRAQVVQAIVKGALDKLDTSDNESEEAVELAA